jgi:hypothetical protein
MTESKSGDARIEFDFNNQMQNIVAVSSKDSSSTLVKLSKTLTRGLISGPKYGSTCPYVIISSGFRKSRDIEFVNAIFEALKMQIPPLIFIKSMLLFPRDLGLLKKTK